jgi:hypothetical protein
MLAATAAFGLIVSACRYAPTQCEILFDTNVERSRVAKLEVYVLRGALSIGEVRDRLAQSATGAVTYRGSAWPVTATVVPPEGAPRSGVVTVFATMDVAATTERGATQIERLHRFSLIERQPQRGRVVFDARCTDRAQGCTTAGECTVSRRCLELGATCGDDGECVNVELPTVSTPAVTERDGAFGADATAADVTVQREDAGIDSPDGAVSDVAADRGDTGLDLDSIAFRPVSPLSGSAVSSLRPTLRWSNTDPMIQSTLELCRDRACATPVVIDADGNQARPPADLAPGPWFWRVRARLGARRSTAVSPQWQLWIPARASTPDTDTVLGSRFDCNGDGIADFVGGAPLAVRGTATGVVHVWHGAVMPMPTTPARVLAAMGVGEGFGESVANAGDVNGDGYSDLIVGAPLSDPGGSPGAGSARVYLGSPSGISASPWFTITGRTAGDQLHVVAGGGDLNGDGYGDIAVGSPTGINLGLPSTGYVFVYLGGRDTMRLQRVLTGSDSFGSALAVMGDRNDDGLSELVVGQPMVGMAGSELGSVLVFDGNSAGIAAMWSSIFGGDPMNRKLGASVANGGDVNGDGLADILVGAPEASPGGLTNAGSMRVYFGRDALPVQAIPGRSAGDAFGSTVATAGDINGSGRWAALAGAPEANPMGRTRAGEASIFFASAMGLITPAVRVFPGGMAGDQYGDALGSPGDVNGDGRSDMVIGATTINAGRGGLTILAGDVDAVDLRRSYTVAGETIGDSFGGSVMR